MDYNLIHSARSDEETKAALDHYDKINPDKGSQFLLELLQIYKTLSVSPQYYSFLSAKRTTTLRDVKLPSFPYVVVYEINRTDVLIISVRSTHQKPFVPY